ncbi:hypothetical protein FOZ62_007596, partial [Perkinsus olseni]
MLDFLDPFWKWLFLGVDLDYFVNSSEYREGWWKYATTTYLGWLLGIGSVIMFVGLVMFAGLCGARRATFMTMLFVFLFILACTILADYYLPQIWATFKRSISKRISQGSSYLLFEFMNEQPNAVAAAVVEYDELTGEHNDDESQVRRLNIWKFLGDQGEKFGVKVFNKYLG